LVKFTPFLRASDYMQIKFECVCPTPLMFIWLRNLYYTIFSKYIKILLITFHLHQGGGADTLKFNLHIIGHAKKCAKKGCEFNQKTCEFKILQKKFNKKTQWQDPSHWRQKGRPRDAQLAGGTKEGRELVPLRRLKFDERKAEMCWFGSGKWFWLSIIARSLLWLVKRAAPLYTCRKGCNKYDVTACQCLWLAHHNHWSRWFAISTPQPIWGRIFSFLGRDVKK